MTQLLRWGTLLVLTGCVTTAGSAELKRTMLKVDRPAGASAAGWRRVQAPEFTLVTDLDADAAERAALLLAQSLAGLKAMFARAPVVDQRDLTVYAMRDSLEFERRFGKEIWGRAFSFETGTELCLYGPPDRWSSRSELTYEVNESVLQHELAHAVLRRYFPSQPLWFAEGMAQYLETSKWVDAETVRLGDPKLEAYRSYRAIRSLTVKDLLSWKNLDERQLTIAGYYGLSWALVHYARNKRPRELAMYMATLAKEGPDAAWEKTFAARATWLDEELYAFMKVGEYQPLVLKVPLGAPASATMTPLTDDEAKAVDAHLEALGELTHTPSK